MLHKLSFYPIDQDAIFGVLDGVLRLGQEGGSPGLQRVRSVVELLDETLLQRSAKFRDALMRGDRNMANNIIVTDEEIDLLGSIIAVLDWGLATNSVVDSRHINTIRMTVTEHTGKRNI